MKSKEIVGMILAGGKGTRLETLTKKQAKPAVYFGGKYRIIDFPLSNCANSGIDTVAVLTQYESITLNKHIGVGSHWGFNSSKSGITMLPPRQKEDGAHWYSGTADAVFQNMDYIESHNPEYILILSGDHIYKMDYSRMLEFHKEKNADVSIGVIEVPWDEASRFGIMNTEIDGTISEFQEKPKHPKNNLASMGIYIFKWKVLKDALNKDIKNRDSDRDFGKNIIPMLLNENKKLFAYSFKGYWKDVGTVDSLWESNMDLLKENCELDLYEDNWRIYSTDTEKAPQYIGAEARVKNSMINQGCKIYGQVENSVLFPGVIIEKGARVVNSVIMPNVIVKSGAFVNKAIVEADTVIKNGLKMNTEGIQVQLIPLNYDEEEEKKENFAHKVIELGVKVNE